MFRGAARVFTGQDTALAAITGGAVHEAVIAGCKLTRVSPVQN
jgi:hypothetical protein